MEKNTSKLNNTTIEYFTSFKNINKSKSKSKEKTQEIKSENLNQSLYSVKYDLNDEDLKTVEIGNEIKGKIIKNEHGIFIDIRKYNFNKFPTNKGIRLTKNQFIKLTYPIINSLNA